MTPSDPSAGGGTPRASNEGSGGGDSGRKPGELDPVWAMAVQLVAATLTWGGIGWLADRWLGTQPWLTWSGLIMGTGVGIYMLSLDARRRVEDAGPQETEGAGNASPSDERPPADGDGA